MLKNKLRQIWQKLSFRERVLTSILVFIIIPIILIWYIVWPIINFSDSLSLSELENKERIIKLNNNIEKLNELKRLNVSPGFDFMKVSKDIFTNSGITDIPDIKQNKADFFGSSYIIRFSALRNDQIFRLLYNLENNSPPIIIEKFETSESIQRTKLASLTLIIKTE